MESRKQIEYTWPDPFDFFAVKDRIVFRLMPADYPERTEQILPFRRRYGFSVVYYLTFEDTAYGRLSIPITERILSSWSLSETELFHLALKNTPAQFPAAIRPMTSMLGLPPDPDQELFVMTNTTCFYGAASLLYPGRLAEAAERLRGDFWVLPSSVHEVILLSCANPYEEHFLSEMVREINREHVTPEEILGSHVCRYDCSRALLLEKEA